MNFYGGCEFVCDFFLLEFFGSWIYDFMRRRGDEINDYHYNYYYNYYTIRKTHTTKPSLGDVGEAPKRVFETC